MLLTDSLRLQTLLLLLMFCQGELLAGSVPSDHAQRAATMTGHTAKPLTSLEEKHCNQAKLNTAFELSICCLLQDG